MPGPLQAPTVLLLYPFRFRDPVSGKWVRARYVAERSKIAERHVVWEIVGQPEYRRPLSAMFNPLRSYERTRAP